MTTHRDITWPPTGKSQWPLTSAQTPDNFPCRAGFQRRTNGGNMFKVEAKRTPEGSYNVAASCSKGHTSFKKSGDHSSAYKCPFCGSDVY